MILNIHSWIFHSDIFVESPYRYMNAAKDYLEWSPSKTILGQGGDFPGLNTGVVLFNLTR